jgi:MerR family copper efflux transcriptional regulator
MSNYMRLPVLAKNTLSPSLDGLGEELAVEPPGPLPSHLSETAAIPSLMQIGDLARESGKTVRAIHLYEELQLLKPAARSKGRFRLYGAEALVRIRWIGKLQEMGFSLSDIQTVVKDWEQQGSAPRAMFRMREVYRRKLAETQAQARRLQALEHELQASLHYLETCEVCDPDRLLTACNHCDMHDCAEKIPELVAGFRAANH